MQFEGPFSNTKTKLVTKCHMEEWATKIGKNCLIVPLIEHSQFLKKAESFTLEREMKKPKWPLQTSICMCS